MAPSTPSSDWKPSGHVVGVAGTGAANQLSAEAAAVASALGAALAEAGHGLVTGGWPGVDCSVAHAYVAALRRLYVDPKDFLTQIVQRDRTPSVQAGKIVFVDNGIPEYTETLRHANALVLVGGLGGTYNTYLLAKALGVPVLPIAATEGDARRAYIDIRRSWDSLSAYSTITLRQFEELAAPSADPEATAATVLVLLGHVLSVRTKAPAVIPQTHPAPAVNLGADNEKVLQKLIDAFRDPGVIGFVGAGISMRAGYPSWTKLLELMEQELSASPFASQITGVRTIPDLIWRAGRYRRELGDNRFNQLIRRLFGRSTGQCDDFHRDLVKLPFRQIVTTNYDDLLDRAHVKVFATPADRVEWDNESEVQDFLQDMVKADAPRRYVYLHGRFDNPLAIVLTEQDYRERYIKNGETTDAKLAHLFSRCILFAGFSLSDLDVMAIFRRINVHLGFEAPRHFALMALDTSREDPWAARTFLNERYGIDPIFYPWSSDHRGLQDLVRRLLEGTAPE
ncbi:SIR2 family protein [Sorangium sp. So ce388]|uniref:SIR2 family protein n=1 Tax=Sorangium sp. So ce388 TaxID=3133309 RepID=UPI003F5BCA3E